MSENGQILLKTAELSRIFPFLLLLDQHCRVEDYGRSMAKLFPGSLPGTPFFNQWSIVRPKLQAGVACSLESLVGKLVVIVNNDKPDLRFKGQFEKIEFEQKYLFLGAPWLDDTDQLLQYDLTLDDFALYDSMTDLLHVLKNNEIANREMKEVVNKVSKQRHEMAQSNARLEFLQSLIDNSSDAVQVSYEDGQLFYINQEAASRLGIKMEEAGRYNVRDFEKIFENPLEWQKHVDDLKAVAYLTVEGENVHQRTGDTFPVEVTVKYLNVDGKGYIIANSRDITERRKSEEQLRIQEEKYRNIIANMNLGLLEVDKDDRIQYANQSFCELSGYTLEEMLGEKAADLFASEGAKQRIEEKNQLRENGQSDSFEIIVRNKRGEARWWLISGAPRYNDFGTVVGSIGIHLDITEQKRLEKELSRALYSAQEASEAKAAFLANMSHEIRTPLNGVLGMIRELGKEPLSLRQNSCLISAKKASEHLLSIINNILDISKIEAGELQLEQLNFSIRDVLNDVSSILESQANERLIEFRVVVEETVADAFLGDATRIRQILINLAGNAIKFTEKGSVTIVCAGHQVNKYHQELIFSIRDTGIGMDEEFTQKIFTKFQQADKSSSRRFGGTGLGMAITKELIEMMNGSITVQSEKGVGTEVCAQLMLPVGDVTKIEMANNLPLQVALENRSVLLVEDNEMNRMVAINALLPYKMIVTEAENGLEAIEILKKDTFDLILMDLQMPVMGGLEAMRILRQSLKIKTPVVALTANAFKSEIDLCINAGMADYVVKPFEEKNLIQAIAKALAVNNKPGSQELPNTTIPSESTEVDTHLYDLTKLKALSRGDEAFVLKMLGLFADMMPRAITEMQTAVNAQDFENLQKVVHRIKPSVDNMGIVSIRSHIREIEQADIETERMLMIDHTRFIADVLERVVAEVRRSELHPPTS